MPTVMVTFAQATLVPATFVHIKNISAITDPIMTKFFGPNFFGALNFFEPKNLVVQKNYGPKSVVEIWSVTAEIFLIWINVTRRYFYWTNVTMTVGIC